MNTRLGRVVRSSPSLSRNNRSHQYHLPASHQSYVSSTTKILVFVFVTFAYTTILYRRGGAGTYLAAERTGDVMLNIVKGSARRKITVSTWNVAAINNNPFEYWITMPENPAYEKLMKDVELFLEEPGPEKDVPVSEVFTEQMFHKLNQRIVNDAHWSSVQKYWDEDFKNRKIVSGFLKDKELGSKRLASMPDRVTNTINVVSDEMSEPMLCRPTVINMYGEDLSTLDIWWTKWEKFMFDTTITVNDKNGEKTGPIYNLLVPIKKAKYPAITEDEEKDSLPLQTMCQAIFDAILVHMMNTVSTPDSWQPLKRTIVDSLNKKKVPRTMEILERTYSTSDIITLQEVSYDFVKKATSGPLGTSHHVIAPQNLDAVRDQNSVIMLTKDVFPVEPIEVSDLVYNSFEKGVDSPAAAGDILAISATDKYGVKFIIVSFHGDTNGLATIPVLQAVMKAIENDVSLSDHHLIFGLDANTYEKGSAGKKQDVLAFGESYRSYGLTSCWGDIPNPSNYTTFNARTYLQPQLNKACKSTEKREKGDVNPKDFILFSPRIFVVDQTWKDNTGEKSYVEDVAFPTLKFPSDHGVLSTVLEMK